MNDLRWIADSYMQLQKTRIAMENRLRALAQEKDENPMPEEIKNAYNQMLEAEKNIQNYMKVEIKDHPAWEWLQQVKGVSHTLACKLLSMLDIRIAKHPSSFWKFCGLGVTNGERDKLVKGETAPYSKRAKTTMYLIGSSFLKCNSPYRKFYDEAKEKYQKEKPDWTKGHIHNAAMRKMEKIFLVCLWDIWRVAEGLPKDNPYVVAKLGHEKRYNPDKFI